MLYFKISIYIYTNVSTLFKTHEYAIEFQDNQVTSFIYCTLGRKSLNKSQLHCTLLHFAFVNTPTFLHLPSYLQDLCYLSTKVLECTC